MTNSKNRGRREFLKRAAVVSSGLAAGLGPVLGQGRGIIVCGQIGTKHPHASGKMESMRKLSDIYRVAGVVEPDDVR